MQVRESVQRYRGQSLHYLENALHFLSVGDAAKAGEFLWGSLAEALKAVAASRGIRLMAHWEIGDYARRLSAELQDASINAVYAEASHLHSNFYEVELRVQDISPRVDRIRETVRKVLNLLAEEEPDS